MYGLWIKTCIYLLLCVKREEQGNMPWYSVPGMFGESKKSPSNIGEIFKSSWKILPTMCFSTNFFTTTWAEISEPSVVWRHRFFFGQLPFKGDRGALFGFFRQILQKFFFQWKSRNFLTEFGNHQVVCLQSLTMSDSSHLWWGGTQPKDHWKINNYMFFPQKWKVPFCNYCNCVESNSCFQLHHQKMKLHDTTCVRITLKTYEVTHGEI